MGFYADIYVIKKSRSKTLAEAFLNYFLPKRVENTNVYELPRFGNQVKLTFESADELMIYLEENPIAEQCIYCKNPDTKSLNRYGMIFYTPDSYMIFGISRYIKEKEGLEELKEFLNTETGYITYECPPENTYVEFIDAVNRFLEIT